MTPRQEHDSFIAPAASTAPISTLESALIHTLTAISALTRVIRFSHPNNGRLNMKATLHTEMIEVTARQLADVVFMGLQAAGGIDRIVGNEHLYQNAIAEDLKRLTLDQTLFTAYQMRSMLIYELIRLHRDNLQDIGLINQEGDILSINAAFIYVVATLPLSLKITSTTDFMFEYDVTTLLREVADIFSDPKNIIRISREMGVTKTLH
jgi:hypothetical protein